MLSDTASAIAIAVILLVAIVPTMIWQEHEKRRKAEEKKRVDLQRRVEQLEMRLDGKSGDHMCGPYCQCQDAQARREAERQARRQRVDQWKAEHPDWDKRQPRP